MFSPNFEHPKSYENAKPVKIKITICNDLNTHLYMHYVIEKKILYRL